MRLFLSSIEAVYNISNKLYHLSLPKLEIVYNDNLKLTNLEKLDLILIKFEELLTDLKKSKNEEKSIVTVDEYDKLIQTVLFDSYLSKEQIEV